MLASAVDDIVNRDGFKATVAEIGGTDEKSFAVLVSANKPAVLASLVLRYQRQI